MGDTLRNFVGYFLQGVRDCFYGFYGVYKVDASIPKAQPVVQQGVLAQRRAAKKLADGVEVAPVPQKRASVQNTVMSRIIRCCIANGGIILSQLVLFTYIGSPCLQALLHLILQDEKTYQSAWQCLQFVVDAILGTFWVYPLWLITRITNVIWFQDVADAAWHYKGKQKRLPGISTLLSDLVYNTIAQLLFIQQGVVLEAVPIPYIGRFVGLLHVSILTSLYAFEYRWILEGVDFSSRIRKIEHQWPYFFGFGLPVGLLLTFSSSLWLNGCLFAIAFPLLIVSAHEATEIRRSFDFPLPLFNVIITLTDIIVNSIISLASRPRSAGVTQSTVVDSPQQH